MSQQYIAQCPHCGATFKVQDQHLSAAGGKVRCGSCMQVFNAQQQLEEKGLLGNSSSVIERAFENQQPVHKPEPTKPDPIDEEIEDFVFEDNPEEDAEEKGYAGTKPLEDDFDTSFLEMEIQKEKGFDGLIDEDSVLEEVDYKDSDEKWAKKILEEDTGTSKAPKQEDQKEQSQPSRHNFEGLRIEMEDSEETQKASPDSAPDNLSTPIKPKPAASRQDNLYETSEIFDNSPYGSLRVDPIAATPKKSNSALKTAFWTMLVVVLLIGAVGQVAWHQFDKLVQLPQLRPAYSVACNVLDCELPPLVDISQIRSQNLVVRSHPAVKQSLIIDAVIVNLASFEQPFPRLGLHFSDINNNIVAERVFAPDEYLSGEALELELMPVNSPVKLVIEIRDPGTQAVNYSISFHQTPKS